MDVEQLIADSERKISRLRGQIESEEQFLRELRRRLPARTVRVRNEAVPDIVVAAPATHPIVDGGHRRAAMQETLTNLGRAGRKLKRQIALAAMIGRPGDWTTKDLDRVFADKGIDPDAGTPSKNILWSLAQEEHLIEARGNGLYHLSPLQAERLKAVTNP